MPDDWFPDDEPGTDGDDAPEDDAPAYLTFDLSGQALGIDVAQVREIVDPRPITRLPNAPPDVRGVVDVRGASVPILDLRSILALDGSAAGAEARIVVIEIGADRRAVGIEADRVRNVERIEPAEVEAVPTRGLGRWDADGIRGLCRRGAEIVVLLDLDRVPGLQGRTTFDAAQTADIA
jgi:purine-binding chemotaxis protein CheW